MHPESLPSKLVSQSFLPNSLHFFNHRPTILGSVFINVPRFLSIILTDISFSVFHTCQEVTHTSTSEFCVNSNGVLGLDAMRNGEDGSLRESDFPRKATSVVVVIANSSFKSG